MGRARGVRNPSLSSHQPVWSPGTEPPPPSNEKGGWMVKKCPGPEISEGTLASPPESRGKRIGVETCWGGNGGKKPFAFLWLFHRKHILEKPIGEKLNLPSYWISVKSSSGCFISLQTMGGFWGGARKNPNGNSQQTCKTSKGAFNPLFSDLPKNRRPLQTCRCRWTRLSLSVSKTEVPVGTQSLGRRLTPPLTIDLKEF